MIFNIFIFCYNFVILIRQFNFLTNFCLHKLLFKIALFHVLSQMIHSKRIITLRSLLSRLCLRHTIFILTFWLQFCRFYNFRIFKFWWQQIWSLILTWTLFSKFWSLLRLILRVRKIEIWTIESEEFLVDRTHLDHILIDALLRLNHNLHINLSQSNLFSQKTTFDQWLHLFRIVGQLFKLA